jgi:hypothetical protein
MEYGVQAMRELGEAMDVMDKWEVTDAIREIEETYIAGGAVVDTLLNVDFRDIDVFTEHPADVVDALFEIGYRLSEEPGSVFHEKLYARMERNDDPVVDIIDVEHPDGPYIGMVNCLGQFDFQCNAIAYDPRTRSYFHMENTLKDIPGKRLTPIGEPPRYRWDRMISKGWTA